MTDEAKLRDLLKNATLCLQRLGLPIHDADVYKATSNAEEARVLLLEIANLYLRYKLRIDAQPQINWL